MIRPEDKELVARLRKAMPDAVASADQLVERFFVKMEPPLTDREKTVAAMAVGFVIADLAPSGKSELYGPFGWLNGCRGLSEDSWTLESDPLENSEEYFAIPLYALTDPFKEIGPVVSSDPVPAPSDVGATSSRASPQHDVTHISPATAQGEAEAGARQVEQGSQDQDRDAFKAGWWTNADYHQPAAYLEDCEEADWREYQKNGLDDYVSNLLQAARNDSEVAAPAPVPDAVDGMVYAPHVMIALAAAHEAVTNSRPTHDHYPEPRERHERALRLLEDAMSKPHALASNMPVEDGAANRIIGQIEERFPNWRSYRDLIDCIDCTLADLRRDAR